MGYCAKMASYSVLIPISDMIIRQALLLVLHKHLV